MKSVLITAFEPYDRWTTNASWLALVELTREMPSEPTIVTRLYPVDYAVVFRRLSEELLADYDLALHLGQAPGSTHVRLEQIAINVATRSGNGELATPLVPEGPVAYRSQLPLEAWAGRLRAEGVPAEVSHHAGTYLCNAILYYTHYLAERHSLRTRAAMIHLPPDVTQVVGEPGMASLPVGVSAQAIRIILSELRGKKQVD